MAVGDKPIKGKEIIDVGTDLTKLVKEFTKLEKSAVKSLNNISKAGTRLKNSLNKIEKEIRDNVKVTEQLTTSNDQNEKQLKETVAALTKLAKKYGQTQSAIKNTDKLNGKLGKSLGDQRKRVKLLKEEYESLDPTIDGNAQRLSQLATKISRTRAEIKQLSDASNKLNKSFNESETSYNGLIQQNAKIRSILNKLPREFIETNKRAQALVKTFERNTQALKDFDASLGQNFRNVGNYGSALSGLNSLASNFIKGGIQGGIGGFILKQGKAFVDATKAVEKNAKAVSKLFKGGRKDIESYTASATGIVEVFDKDFNEVIKTANALTENFGITGSESFDIIEEALIRGLDLNDDFLDQLAEYSVQFAEAGIDADTFVEVLLKAEDKGVFSDKAADAVKEVTIRLRELTPATRDAIAGLGLSVEQIERDLRSGARSSFEVIKEISGQLDKFPDQSREVGTAIADIFGGPGEDAGLAFLKSLKDINVSTGDYRKNLTESQKVTADYLDSQKELNAELLAFSAGTDTASTKVKTFFNDLKIFGLKVLGDITRNFTDLTTRLEDFKKSINEVQDINTAKDALKNINEELEQSKKSFIELAKEGDFSTFFRKALNQGAAGFGGAGAAITNEVERRTELIVQKNLTEKKIAELESTAAEDAAKRAREAQEKLNQESKEVGIQRRKAIREQNKLILEEQIKLLEETAENEDASLNERLAAFELISAKQVEIAQIEKQDKLDVTQQLLDEEKSLIALQEQQAIDAAKRTGKARAEALLESLEAVKDSGDLDAILDKELTNRLNSIETGKNAALTALEERELSTRDKEQAIFDIEEEFRRKSLQATLAFLQNKKNLITENESERIDIQRQISEIELQLAQTTTDKSVSIREELNEKVITLAETLFDFLNVSTENQLIALEERQARNTELEEQELESAGDNEQAKTEIRKKFQKEQEKIEEERAKVQRRQAIFQKLQAISQIGIDTAKGIGAQLPGLPFTAPLISAITAIGAAQIAAVVARKIPAFEKGTESAPGGIALVSEKGPELMYDPITGAAYLTPNKPALMDVPEGAQIFDAVTTRRMMAESGSISERVINENDNRSLQRSAKRTQAGINRIENSKAAQAAQNIDYNRLGKAVGKHLPPTYITEIGQDGIVRNYVKLKNGSIKENLNKRTTLISDKHPISKQLDNLNDEVEAIKSNNS